MTRHGAHVPHLNVKQSGATSQCEPWLSCRDVAPSSLNLRH